MNFRAETQKEHVEFEEPVRCEAQMRRAGYEIQVKELCCVDLCDRSTQWVLRALGVHPVYREPVVQKESS